MVRTVSRPGKRLLSSKKELYHFERVQRTFARILEASEKSLAEMRSISAQMNSEIDRLKATLLLEHGKKLLSHFEEAASVQDDQLLGILQEAVGRAGHEHIPFESFLLLLQSFASALPQHRMLPRGIRESVSKGTAASRRTSLKILYVTGMFPSRKHGGGLRVHDILMELVKRHKVDLYSVFHPAIDRPSPVEFERFCRQFGAVRLCHGDTNFSLKDVLKWLNRRSISPQHYDVIQFEYPDSVPLMQGLRPFGKKLGYTLMESLTRHHLLDVVRFASHPPERAGKSFVQLLRSMRIEEKALRLADFSIAVTDADAQFTRRVFGREPVVVPTGLSESFFGFHSKKVSRFDFPHPDLRKSVVFIGYYDHFPNRDGVEWYIKHVHGSLARRYPDYHFYVVGGGGQAWVDQLRHRYLSDSQISVIGYVEDFRTLVGACKVSVAPLISGAGIRGKINQYAALGVPTVATPLAACGTEYQNGESILLARTGKQFASRVAMLLGDAKFRSEVSSRAKHLVRSKYVWTRLVKDLETVYGYS